MNVFKLKTPCVNAAAPSNGKIIDCVLQHFILIVLKFSIFDDIFGNFGISAGEGFTGLNRGLLASFGSLFLF